MAQDTERPRTSLLGLLPLLPLVVAASLLAAHFLRAGQLGLSAASIGACTILFLRRRWVAHAAQLLLVAGALVWLSTLVKLAHLRAALGLPWARLAVILGTLALVTAGAALVLESRSLRARYAAWPSTARPSLAAFVLTSALLAVVQLAAPRPMLLLERYVPGGGWLEILVLAVYAGHVAERLLDGDHAAAWRRRIWSLFSVVFFAQLALGLVGVDRLLMTGKLHWPIPAMIVAGPIYRGGPLFMLVLFCVTVLLVGPAWCSHICYIGAWDHAASRARTKPRTLPRWSRAARPSMLIVVVAAALALRLLGASAALSGALALALGLGGVAVMLILSRRLGAMVHCLAYCPIGALAAWLGRLSPFRIRIGAGCDECARCRLACRYDALGLDDIRRRRPASSCTLCGDCLASCPTGQLHCRFLGLRPERARALFVVLAVTLHAASLGLARI